MMMFKSIPVWAEVSCNVKATSAAEAISAAGLNWNVSKRPLFREDGVKSSGCALVRDDKALELAVVGQRYRPYQNDMAFNVVNPLIEAGLVELIAAGAINEGERVFILGKVVGTHGEINGEVVDLHILLTNSHGYGAVTFGFVPIVRSSGVALSPLAWNGGGRVRVTHTGDVNGKITRLREAMDLAKGAFTVSLQQLEDMKAHGLTSESFKDIVKVALNIKDVEGDDGRKLAKILERGAHVTNALEAYMTLADYFNSSNAGRNANSILKSLWYGSGRKQLSDCFDACSKGGANVK